MTKRFLVLTLTCAALLEPGCKQQSGSSHRAGAQASVASVAQATSMAFAPAREYRYAVELSSQVDYGAGTQLALNLQGRLELQRESSDAGTLTLAARLHEARFAQAEPGAEQQFAELAAELGRGFVLALEMGKIKEVRSVGAVSAFAANIMRTLAAAFELPAPPAGTASSWTAQSADAAGQYVVELSPLAVPGRYRKRKLHYLETTLRESGDAAFSLTLLPRILESGGELELRQGVLHSCRYEEKLESELGRDARVSAQNRLSLTLLESRAAGPLAPRSTTPLDGADPRLVKVDRSAMDAAKIGGMSFDDAVAKLKREATAAPTERGTSSATPDPAFEQRMLEHNKAFSALTAILRTQPELVPRAVTLIRSGKAPAKLVLDALAAADTAPSHAALIAFLDDSRLSRDLRAAAAQGLTRIEAPSADTLEALLRLTRTPEQALIAVYGLGTQARHLKQRGELELARRAGLALVEQLETAASEDARVHALRGIANSGLSECLPAVAPLLTDDSELLRAAAVEALRLMDDPRVDALIAARLSEEKRGFALRAALTAAKARRPSRELNAGVVAVATGASDQHSRFDAIALLVRWLPELPSLREVLLRVAENDSVEAIRQAARAAL